MFFKSPLISVFILMLLVPNAAIADIQKYMREYVHRVGGADSKASSRQISTQEIKVELLAELGTFINSRIEISQGNRTETEFKEEIIALTAGFVQVDILEEKFDGETYYMKAMLSADPEDVVIRINELSKSNKQSQQDKAALLQAYKDNKAIRVELSALQEELRIATAEGKETQNLEKRYLVGSEQLSIAALYEVGNDHYWGRKGKPQDYDLAAKRYSEAAEQGYANAQYNLGVMYQRGDGVSQDNFQAVAWFRKAAAQNLPQAQYNLGVMYRKGSGVTKDNLQAIDWYRKATQQGHAAAQYNLGLMYLNGLGVTKDNSEAVAWFRKAAEQDLGQAQFNLGLMYIKGLGVNRDGNQTIYWWKKSAEQGFDEAQYKVGLMYQKGLGVAKNPNQALTWLGKAATQGHVEAKHALSNMR